MIFCGLKLTHDGAICVIDRDELVFCAEMEKLNNNDRYTDIDDTRVVEEILDKFGYRISDIDVFSVDGWGGNNQDELAIQPRLRIGAESNFLTIKNFGEWNELKVAQYTESKINEDILKAKKFDQLRIGTNSLKYESYLHVTSHILSAYCTSPFAARKEEAYILVWDGGMFPRLYFFSRDSKLECLGPIFLLIGNIYTVFSQHFGPFKVKNGFAKDSLSIAGKVMAYIAHGEIRAEMIQIFEKVYRTQYSSPMGFANHFANEFKRLIQDKNFSEEDVLRTFHFFLENLIVKKLEKKISKLKKETRNLCIVGGCALNIKWNGAIRNSGLFENVYVPPFPNDSGSALGSACASMLNSTGVSDLKWDVYSGMRLGDPKLEDGWMVRSFSVKALAHLLFLTNEPVVFLSGRAELGPRALGHRSILAAPVSASMKDKLNDLKDREPYRPVSPICLVQFAPEIFDPGIPDPYMLFDHRVKGEWLDKIPAVCHLDGTARLQTVDEYSCKEIFDLLTHYWELTGIPLLCNTSANLKGKGFFPDVQSAMKWGRVKYIWSNNFLYERTV